MGNYTPLVTKYFGNYLDQLVAHKAANDKFNGRFVNVNWESQSLEARLEAIETLGLTKAIVCEIGKSDGTKPEDLDNRLMNVWAELRFISQLQREGFSHITKVKKTADFTAERENQKYAFQVTRINSALNEIAARKKKILRPYGSICKIYKSFIPVLDEFFWDSLEGKNGKFRKWSDESYKRCIVLVSSEEQLQDRQIRHIACQRIRKAIHNLVKVHFEELIWLPDTGNGAWFIVGNQKEETTCFVNWQDDPGEMIYRTKDSVKRRVVNLNTLLP